MDYNFYFKFGPLNPDFEALSFSPGLIGEIKILTQNIVGEITQDEINAAVAAYVEDHPGSLQGLSDDIKQGILNCFQHVAWRDDEGPIYYQALYDALYPPVSLASIDAVFTQGAAVIYDTDTLESLRQYLVVTATYTDSTTADVTDACTLTGTLTAGTSTITATYGGKTDTFTVTVTHDSRVMLYHWDFTQGLTDSIQSAAATLGRKVGAYPTQDAFGVHITTSTGYIDLGQIYQPGLTVEIDFGEMDLKQTGNARLLMIGTPASSGLQTGFIYRSTQVWSWYANGSWCTSSGKTDGNMFSEKTLKAVFGLDGKMTVYCGDELVGTSSRAFVTGDGTMQICAQSGTGGYNSFYDMTVKEVRIYTEGE